jgi:hypothetical protein
MREAAHVRVAVVAAAVAASAAAAVLAGGCADVASTRDVRATVIDEDGTPVPGAVFYAEVRDADGPFAFEWRIAGAAGEIPDSAYRPLQLPWRPDARVAFAAFAPGRRAAVHVFPDGRPRTDGAVLTLPRADSGWNADLAALACPFEDAPKLAALLREPANAPLREALRAAWADRPGSPPPTGAELRKLADLGLR